MAATTRQSGRISGRAASSTRPPATALEVLRHLLGQQVDRLAIGGRAVVEDAHGYDVPPSALLDGEGLIRSPSDHAVAREGVWAALDSGEVPRTTPPREGVMDACNNWMGLEPAGRRTTRPGCLTGWGWQ